MQKITYRDSGVDLDTYQESMARLPKLMRRTHCPRVLPWNNGFAGLFRLDFSKGLFSRDYQEPVLVSGTDGVGTKLKVAQMVGRHDSIGIDLVAMCVNDVICCGAEPLFFLDYVAMAEDDPELLEQIVTGISDGCFESDAALIGGETAIMPDLYQRGDYDLAGFCVGIAERSRLLDGSHIVPGDVVLGLASDGIHSNGYSLVRKIVFEHAGLSVDDQVETCGSTVGELLLQPTRLYARPVREVLNHYKVKSVVHGISHITGGGLHENLARILPAELDAEIRRDSWTIPPVFFWLQDLGGVDESEMYRVFNMGIGLTMVVSDYYAESVQQQLTNLGLKNWQIGQIVEGCGNCRWV
ncbi:MAG: phosphoribosylformylglycinamidine cyclo-ligase [Planctomycetales bacterium]|nr:phosphoribosylformylglycinamidine cyclo-ligase [Planctomycetales bacterium]